MVQIFRIVEPLVFPNAKYVDSQIVDYTRDHTKKCYAQADRESDLLYNEPAHDKSIERAAEKESLPRLNTIILYFPTTLQNFRTQIKHAEYMERCTT